MSEAMTDPYPLRLPPAQRVRLEQRARRQGVKLSVLLRRYIDDGDAADTQHEETT